jgi:hypothetical protein
MRCSWLSFLLHFQRFGLRFFFIYRFAACCLLRPSHARSNPPHPLILFVQAMAAFPESAKKINQDIADNKWFQ